jgi:protein-L-isoaspartate O-methyltransferase
VVCAQDTPVPIACGQHMDSASTVARFVSLLEPYVQPGAHVLDVGAGGCKQQASSHMVETYV